MTFLKKLGQILAQGVGVVTGLWPLLAPLFGSSAAGAKAGAVAGTVIQDLTQVANIVITAESIIQTPGSGSAKLQAATPLVAQIVRSSEVLAGKKIANEDLFIQGCMKLTDGMADVLNSIHPDAAAHAPTS